MTRDAYESESTVNAVDAAAALNDVADGLLAGSIRLGDGDDAIAVDAPAELSLEIEFEREDDELSLELELEWDDEEGGAVSPAESADEDAAAAPSEDGDDTTTNEDGDATATDDGDTTPTEEATPAVAERAVPVGAADGTQSLARFEVFEDKAGEFRWRLRHRNGNIVATSGEGYTRRHNAWKGMRSVMRNAPGADVVEE